MRRAAKVDANQPEIVDALRTAGASVQHLHTIGQGCCDLLVGHLGHTYLMEVKDGNGEMTPDEREWMLAWRGAPVHIVRSAEDALRVIGALP